MAAQSGKPLPIVSMRLRIGARETLPRAVFDFADGGAEKEWTLRRNEAAFDDVALAAAPDAGCRRTRPVGDAAGNAALHAGDPRADRAFRAVLAARRTLRGPRGGTARNHLLPQSWLGLPAGGLRPGGRRLPLDAAVHLQGPAVHAGVGPAGEAGGLCRPRPHDRQPAAWQPRTRPAERLHHPAPLRRRRHGGNDAQGALAVADAWRSFRHHLWQLCPRGRGRRCRRDSR